MKKISKLLIATLLACSMLLVVVGCNENTTIEKLEWGTMPATEYTMVENATDADSQKLLKFAIKLTTNAEAPNNVITADETTKSITVGAEKKNIIISGFNVATAGTKIATVKIGSFSLTFEYTVTDPNSAIILGDGTKEIPYQISNATQFAQIIDIDAGNKPAGQKYYKITSDIDLSKLTELKYAEKLNTKDANGRYPVFKGVIDGGCYNGTEYTGKNWKLMNYNVSTVIEPGKATATENQPGLFYILGNCEFKNLDIVNFTLKNTSAAGAGLFGFGQYKQATIFNDGGDVTTPKTYKFENINVVNANMNTDKNSGYFVGYTYGNIDVSVVNCTVDSASKSISQREGGGFVGSTSDDAPIIKNNYTFTKCVNSSTIITKNPGSMISNGTDTEANATVTNCKFNGKMHRTEKVMGAFATLADKLVDAPWCSRFIAQNISNSSTVGAEFIGVKNSDTNKYTAETIAELVDDITSKHISVPKVTGATHYLLSYIFYANASGYSVVQQISASEVTGDVVTSAFVFPVAIAFNNSTSTIDPATDLTIGHITLPSMYNKIKDNKKEFTIDTATYSVIAYNGDIPLGSVTKKFTIASTIINK